MYGQLNRRKCAEYYTLFLLFTWPHVVLIQLFGTPITSKSPIKEQEKNNHMLKILFQEVLAESYFIQKPNLDPDFSCCIRGFATMRYTRYMQKDFDHLILQICDI